MKATIDIPDELHRKVKAKSAIEGRTVRDVTIQLFRAWVGDAPSKLASKSFQRHKPPDWFGSLRKYSRNAQGQHDMESVRKSIAHGRTGTTARNKRIA